MQPVPRQTAKEETSAHGDVREFFYLHSMCLVTIKQISTICSSEGLLGLAQTKLLCCSPARTSAAQACPPVGILLVRYRMQDRPPAQDPGYV